MSLSISLYIIVCYCTMVNISNDFRHIDTVEVVGSNPIAPTINIKGLQFETVPLFCFLQLFCRHLFEKSDLHVCKRSDTDLSAFTLI
jgi:hypothetical protein